MSVTPVKKNYPKVAFELPELFEGELEVPAVSSLPLKVVDALKNANFGIVAGFLDEHGTEGAGEVFLSLNDEDVELFFKTWEDAQIPGPKSAK